MGHYAIHFDHLMEMLPEEDDGWFRFFGNRMATALLLLRIATEGGATIFPRLNLAIQPEIGNDFLMSFTHILSLNLRRFNPLDERRLKRRTRRISFACRMSNSSRRKNGGIVVDSWTFSGFAADL